jgi:hypothetical protein
MNAKHRHLPGLALLVLVVSGTGLFGQALPMGQEVPTMPRIWNEGRASWIIFAGGTKGAMLGYTRHFESTVTTVHVGYQANEGFGGVTGGLTVGLPLDGSRYFAAVGVGPGFLAGLFDDADTIKGRFALDADLQILYRLSPMMNIGIYTVVATDFRKAYPCFCLCVTVGRS